MDFLLRVVGLSFKTRGRRRRVPFLFIKRAQLGLLGASGQSSSCYGPAGRIFPGSSKVRQCVYEKLVEGAVERTVCPSPLKLLLADLNPCN